MLKTILKWLKNTLFKDNLNTCLKTNSGGGSPDPPPRMALLPQIFYQPHATDNKSFKLIKFWFEKKSKVIKDCRSWRQLGSQVSCSEHSYERLHHYLVGQCLFRCQLNVVVIYSTISINMYYCGSIIVLSSWFKNNICQK